MPQPHEITCPVIAVQSLRKALPVVALPMKRHACVSQDPRMNWRRPWEHHVEHSFLPPNRRIVLSFDIRTKHRTDSRRSNRTWVRQTVVTTTRRSRLRGFQSSSNTHCRSPICCRRFGDLLGIRQGDLEGHIVRLGSRTKCLFDWRALGGRVSGFGYGRKREAPPARRLPGRCQCRRRGRQRLRITGRGPEHIAFHLHRACEDPGEHQQHRCLEQVQTNPHRALLEVSKAPSEGFPSLAASLAS